MEAQQGSCQLQPGLKDDQRIALPQRTWTPWTFRRMNEDDVEGFGVSNP